MTLGALLLTACGGANDAPSDTTAEDVTALPSLPALSLDPDGTTVSGLSSGAFMAVQMHVAHASTIHGAAVFAGGPYDCSLGSVLVATSTCMAPTDASLVPTDTSAVERNAALGLVDSPRALAGSRVFLFGGADDVVVHPAVLHATSTFYRALLPASAIKERLDVPGAGHVFPTKNKGGSCSSPDGTYIGACGIDGAGEALQHLYGKLAPRSEKPEGTLSRFSQSAYGSWGAGMASAGYVYVPRSCVRGAAGKACRLHVVLHGCEQYASGPVGTRFVADTGYLEWADANRIVVVFPQIAPSLLNPKGCWDFWGYTGPAFATKLGPQVSAVDAMIRHLVSSQAKRP
jgi:poly(3-hydroxybutyrate) depolymerase